MPFKQQVLDRGSAAPDQELPATPAAEAVTLV
jgi:hypothetical protein